MSRILFVDGSKLFEIFYFFKLLGIRLLKEIFRVSLGENKGK